MHKSPGHAQYLLIGIVVIFLVVLTSASLTTAADDGEPVEINNRATAVQTSKPGVLAPWSTTNIITQDLNSEDLTPTDLAMRLTGSGVSVSNVSYEGANHAAGTFSGGVSVVGFDTGIILSSGDIANVVGPNEFDSISVVNETPGDSNLTELAGHLTFDAAILEFDFVPDSDRIFIRYLFASEEYNEYVNSVFNDVFAFFVNGENCATVDGIPISVNTINNGNPYGTEPRSNPHLYISNDLSDYGGHINSEMDGFTVVLTCTAAVIPDTTNHIKLAIADASDQVLDSTVLIEAGGFTTDPPSEEFLSRINQVADSGILNLNRIRSDAATIAQHGDYFRGAIDADRVQLGANLVFNLADGIGAAHDTQNLKKAARLACAGCYVPGTWNWHFTTNHPHAARLLNLGFFRLESVPEAKIAEFVGYGGAKFFAAFLDDGAGEVTKHYAMNATRHIFTNANNGMSTIAYPAVSGASENLVDLLDSRRDQLLANLPALPTVDQEAYASDLTSRNRALLVLGAQLDDERMTLSNLRSVHGQNNNEVLVFLLRFGAKQLASAAFDGPGALAVGVPLTAFDYYMDSNQLEESEHMHTVATGALLGAPDALRQTFTTAYTGLDRIGRGLPVDQASGEINYVNNYSQGGSWTNLWNETASWSEISLTNTGSTEATYRVLANYLSDTTRFRLPWATMDLVEEGFITLEPGATGIVRIDYKRADGTKGYSPRSGTCFPGAGCVPPTTINFDVLATNDAGTYFAASTSSVWEPIAVDSAGFKAITFSLGETEIIDPPLTSYVLSAPWTQQHEVHLSINNPFDSAVAVTVTQELPGGIVLTDLGGATQTGNTLTWNTIVDGRSVSSVGFTFQYAADPDTQNTLPAAVLTLDNPIDGQPLSSESNVSDFRAIWPITLDYQTPGYTQPGVSSNTVITATNWLSDDAVEAQLNLAVTDALSETVHVEEKALHINANDSSAATFMLPSTLQKGHYRIRVDVTVNGATKTAFSDWLQVGLPGPHLDYKVAPPGPVEPGDVLTYTVRFTNTTGYPLSGSVITASIPANVTVLPDTVTGNGVIEPEHVQWDIGTVPLNSDIAHSFAVKVDVTADVPGTNLLSEPRFTADETIPAWGPVAWNVVLPWPYTLHLPSILRN